MPRSPTSSEVRWPRTAASARSSTTPTSRAPPTRRSTGTPSACRATPVRCSKRWRAPAACSCRCSSAGINVHGVDASPAMVASCEARLAAAGLATPLFRQDVATLNLPFRYAAAFVAAGSFQLLTDPAAAQKALARIRAHLVAARSAADRSVRSRRGRASARRAESSKCAPSRCPTASQIALRAEVDRRRRGSPHRRHAAATSSATRARSRRARTRRAARRGTPRTRSLALLRDAGYRDVAGSSRRRRCATNAAAERRFSVTASRRRTARCSCRG